MKNSELVSIKEAFIHKMKGKISLETTDKLSVEEPLEIRVIYGKPNDIIEKNISVTMRTPGEDHYLAIGFLFTEGVISSYLDIKDVRKVENSCNRQSQNIVVVELHESVVPNLSQSDRNFYTTSSCGVCGKASIESIKTVNSYCKNENPVKNISLEVLYSLPDKLKSFQNSFSQTGGIHATGLFSANGDLLLVHEDVGRHNALDKLIGNALKDDLLPLNQHILLLSGRASFELIQKAAMAGVSIVASIGAPSSLAVELAKEFNIVLIGFLNENRCNIYNGIEYIVSPALQNI
ncbi:formate dehydrogenase accessory sulfurtransferase FdhD [Marinigracilibium pacificum]|uniref:Sulfur carrier protein FdhD n=1 Tax=Marinigracilibium pacificum TaxID=2729599 RepID=A0A848JBF2_9BACT|nr:formate dehydrogenase accessory sulfurtransferase FdhD [Marinigracilibium pacificum]NMM50352.1 formate dehydrogenase accessory sulfurtransferase FdhD [Marinigracilibium pacificum]